MKKNDKIVITGAAGLVGQNLVSLLSEFGYKHIIAIDKHTCNCALLKKMNPDITVINEDLADKGSWQTTFQDASRVIILHAQINSLNQNDFIRNNITATKNVLEMIKKYRIKHTVHISSCSVVSRNMDEYGRTKKQQEQLVIDSNISCSILRPSIMFGLFDNKNFGWLAHFMSKSPIFPIPGNGRYMRQPLYCRDFCQAIRICMEKELTGEPIGIVGAEEIDYVDIIKLIKKKQKSKTLILKLPYSFFKVLIHIYCLFDKNPPFTTDQLKALCAGDCFEGINYKKHFGIAQTDLVTAFEETFTAGRHQKTRLEE